MKYKETLPTIERKLVYPQYFARFLYRLAVFLITLACYILSRGRLDVTRAWREYGLFSPAWLLLVSMAVTMVCQHFHRPGMSMGRLKQYPIYCDVDDTVDPAQLSAAARTQDLGALKVAAIWLAGNGVIALLFFRGVLGVAELILVSAFYYLSDMICILFFCPFQLFLMKNRCCINCRIFAWGSWMMATPLVLILAPVTLAVVALSLSLLVRWEVNRRRRPQQFWRGTNRSLRCAQCTEQLCRAKAIPTPGFRREKNDPAGTVR